MRKLAILAAALALTGAATQAQIKPIAPIRGIAPIGSPRAPHVDTFKPYEPPKSSSVYSGGAFSPAGEAARQRRQNATPPPGGVFSPEAEAKRQREREKAYHPF